VCMFMCATEYTYTHTVAHKEKERKKWSEREKERKRVREKSFFSIISCRYSLRQLKPKFRRDREGKKLFQDSKGGRVKVQS
jgi:hypothetical protein